MGVLWGRCSLGRVVTASTALVGLFCLVAPGALGELNAETWTHETLVDGLQGYSIQSGEIPERHISFFRAPPGCEIEHVLISWDTEWDVSEVKGQDALFQIYIDGEYTMIPIELQETKEVEEHKNLMLFWGSTVKPQVIDWLSSNERAAVRLIGPPELVARVAGITEVFNLDGISEARETAEDTCKQEAFSASLAQKSSDET